jgi:hypothetical protein
MKNFVPARLKNVAIASDKILRQFEISIIRFTAQRSINLQQRPNDLHH